MYRSKRVLIIEDDPVSSHNLYELFSGYFQEVACVYDGVQGWERFVEWLPDIVITDIYMPHQNGLDLISRIRAHDHNPFVGILTAYSNIPELMQAVLLKLDAFITKPLTHTKFQTLLEKVHHFFHTDANPTPSDLLSPSIRYDRIAKLLYDGSHRVMLSDKEITLLELLIHYRGNVVSYAQIEYAFDDEPSRNAVKILVNRLRKKLPTATIETIPKMGYLLR